MTSTRNNSAGSPPDATPRYAPPKNAGGDDPLAALIAQSEAAADALLAGMDWEAHDAGLLKLAAQSDRAAQQLLAQDNAFTPGTGSGVHSGTGDRTT